MTSSRKGIIRGTDIDGVTFCSPSGHIESADHLDRQEKESLKALEEFWYTKGQKEGQDKGFEAGFEEGQSSGLKRGKEEGLRLGRQEGEQAGYDKGLEAGRQESIDQFQHAISLLEQAAEQLRSERKQLFSHLKPELIRFALAVCGKVLRQQLKDPDILAALVEDMLDQATPMLSEMKAHVVLSSESKTILGDRLDSIGVYHDIGGLRWIVDKQMPANDLRIECDDGMLHFNLERQLEELEQRVLEAEELPAEPAILADEMETRDADISLSENSSHPSLIPGKDHEPDKPASNTD